jgi:hypothetical protein
MKQTSLRFLPAFLLAMVIITSSCGSSRFYKGYTYQGSAAAPDVSGEARPLQNTENQAPASLNEAAKPSTTETNIPEAQAMSTLAAAQQEEVQMVADVAIREARKMSGEEKEITHTNLAKEVTGSLVGSGKIMPLNAKQEKKLSKFVSKLDRKMKKQGKEIDWKNNSGLELFFMIMAIAGLVLGIIGQGWGWFVFIVFAGLWLYWKLVKD